MKILLSKTIYFQFFRWIKFMTCRGRLYEIFFGLTFIRKLLIVSKKEIIGIDKKEEQKEARNMEISNKKEIINNDY